MKRQRPGDSGRHRSLICAGPLHDDLCISVCSLLLCCGTLAPDACARALGANNCCPYNNSKTEDAQCVCVCVNRAHGAEMFMSHRALQNGSGRTADGLHSLWTGALESVLACERIYCTDNDDGRSLWRRPRQQRAPCQTLAAFGGSINVRGKVKNRSLPTTVNEPRAFVRVCAFLCCSCSTY